MKTYETLFIVQPNATDEEVQAAATGVETLVTGDGGAVTVKDIWGKRRLAYPIQHHRDASYFLIHFDIEPAAVRDIERGLLISEEILRHLVVVLEPRHRRDGDGEDTPAYTDENEGTGEGADARTDAGGGNEEPMAERAAGDGADGETDDEEPAGVAAPEEVAG